MKPIALSPRCVPIFFTTSFICGQRLLMTDTEKLAYVDLVEKVAAYSHVRLLDSTPMATHDHGIVLVSAPADLADGEILADSEHLYGANSKRHLQLVARLDAPASRQAARDEELARKFDFSAFLKTLHEILAPMFNLILGRTGTMVDGPTHRTILDRQGFLRALVYCCLNPARAGLETLPGQIPTTCYGMALRGKAWARAAIMYATGASDFATALHIFEQHLARIGQEPIPGKRALTAEEAEILASGRNHPEVTHPVDWDAPLGAPVCPPPMRPAFRPKASDTKPAAELIDHLARGLFLGSLEHVKALAVEHLGKFSPRRLVALGDGLFAYCRPSAKRLEAAARLRHKTDHAHHEHIDNLIATGVQAMPAADLDATLADESAESPPRDIEAAPTEPTANMPVSPMTNGVAPHCTPPAVTREQAGIWLGHVLGYYRTGDYDPAKLPPARALFRLLAYRRTGDGGNDTPKISMAA